MVISVIIPTLNEEANLSVTLRQLTDHPDVELIVVDGGSTDRTVEIAQRFTPYVFRALPGRRRVRAAVRGLEEGQGGFGN